MSGEDGRPLAPPPAPPEAALEPLAGRLPWSRLRLDGLALRVALFLTIALLPLGLIAIHQTRLVQREGEERAALSLIALTQQSTADLQAALERALLTAEALTALSDLLDDPPTCQARLSRLVGPGAPYAFAGILGPDGAGECLVGAGPLPGLGAAVPQGGQPRVLVGPAGPGGEALTVLAPLPAGGGVVALAQPLAALAPRLASGAQLRPLRLVTFDAGGAPLTAGGTVEDLASLRPAGGSLLDEAGGEARLFGAGDPAGVRRLYSVVPLVPGVAYALAIWSPDQGAQGGPLGRAPLLFPMLMWLASLIVAFWAINRFVLRRIAGLGAAMRRFGEDRRFETTPLGAEDAFELREIDAAFRQTAEAILQDEARMENAFRERGVLLREVHHRVKNNLQLISSMISMQVRRAPDMRTRALLRRLQDRVLTLAAIYRILYRSADMTEVNAAEVLRETLEQELKERLRSVDLRLDDVVLDADKVVPLAFLTAEAVSNAVQHLAPEGRIEVAFEDAGAHATLRVTNPVEAGARRQAREEQPGLGHYLMTAFAQQVGGPVETSTEGGVYRLSVTFPTERDLDAAA